MKNVVSVTEGRPTYVPWYKAILRGLKPGGSTKRSESQSCGKEIYFGRAFTAV